jgi:pimeloyl-ACP methyl ester carboxylesterase
MFVMDVRRRDGTVIAVEVVGAQQATPVLFCHGLGDSRLSAEWFAAAADQLGLCIIAPDRPGIGGTDPHRLGRVADWVQDAVLVLDAIGADTAALLGVSAGGPFAAACAAAVPDRIRALSLVSPLGPPGWPIHGMATGERLSLAIAARVPAFAGWSLERFAELARHWPELFFRMAGTAMPDADRLALRQPVMRESFLASYLEAFRPGPWGAAQDLRVLTRPWGFSLSSVAAPTVVHHGDADTTVPLQHGRLYSAAIPGARLEVHPGQGHFSILNAAREVLAPLASRGR